MKKLIVLLTAMFFAMGAAYAADAPKPADPAASAAEKPAKKAKTAKKKKADKKEEAKKEKAPA